MKNRTTFTLLLILMFSSCSKDTSIKDLDARDGIAYDPVTNNPFNGMAYLDFYDGTLRMEGEYKEGIKSGNWKYYIQGSKTRYYNLIFDKGNITSAQYKDKDRSWSGIPILYTDQDTTIGQVFSWYRKWQMVKKLTISICHQIFSYNYLIIFPKVTLLVGILMANSILMVNLLMEIEMENLIGIMTVAVKKRELFLMLESE